MITLNANRLGAPGFFGATNTGRQAKDLQLAMPGRQTGKWLTVIVLVALAHAGAGYGLSRLKPDTVPPRPPKVIEVALLAPPPSSQSEVTPKQPEPPRPEPRPQPQPKAKAEPVSEPRPVLPPQPPQPVAERVVEQLAEPAPVVVAPPRPTPVAKATAKVERLAELPAKIEVEPVVEAPRFEAAYLNNPRPAYPLAARRRGLEGRVVVRAEVLANGRCNRIELKSTSGFLPLDQAALDAVKKWRFVPARSGSQSVVAWVDVPIIFRLEN